MEFFDAERDFFRCAVCGEMKNMDAYIAPRGIHCGEKVCKSCYESEFETPHFTCCRCNHSTPVSDMHIDSSGNRYCGKCCDIVTSPDYVEDPEESDDAHSSESEIRDVIKVLYELNDSVRDLCALLNEKL